MSKLVKAEVVQPVAENEAIEDLKNLLTEGEFSARWGLLETYHEAGKIMVERLKDISVEQIAAEIGKSTRLVYQMAQFYRTFPDLNALPDGKAISWTRVVKKLLPVPKDQEKDRAEKLKARIDQFIADMYPAERSQKKEFIKEVVTDWEEWK